MTTSNQPDTQRLFIAVELPPDALAALSQLIHGLRASALQGMSLVAAKNIHLTLKFLGNVNTDQIPGLTSTLDSLASKATSFTLELGDVGGFPNLKRTRVLLVDLAGELGVSVCMISRPVSPKGESVESVDEAMDWLARL